MYTLVTNAKGIHELMLDGEKIADFYCRTTGDLVANLLNVTRMMPISSRLQAG